MSYRQIEVQGAPVKVYRQGTGRPLLLLHGNPDSHRTWLPMLTLLPPGIDAIAPDLPGFGGSGVPSDQEVSLDGHVAWMDALVAALDLDAPFDLMVHDIGGILGLAWVARNPERVRRLVISNTIFHADYRWHFWARMWRRPVIGELTMAMLGVPVIGPALFGQTLRVGGPGLSRSQRRETCAEYHARARAQVLTLYRAMDPEHFGPHEAALQDAISRIPTRVIWGARDVFIPRSFAGRFGTSDVHVLEDVGHWVAAEAPQAVADRLVAHLS